MIKRRFFKVLFSLLGLALCVIPVAVCILKYFPVWTARGGETVFSAITLVLIAISAIPLFSFVKRFLRSPASYTIWFILFIFFFLVSNIAKEMVVISFVGFSSNLIGALFFKISRMFGARGDKNERKI